MGKKSKIFLIIGIVCIIALIVGGFFIYWRGGRCIPPIPTHISPKIDFKKVNDTLIVVNIGVWDNSNKKLSDFNLIWDNIRLERGSDESNAILPDGEINIGDVITNCTGGICLVWYDSNEALCCEDFS